jgi:hypothetical protein
MEKLIDEINKVDDQKVYLVAGMDWGYFLDETVKNPVNRKNVAYVTHPYPQKRNSRGNRSGKKTGDMWQTTTPLWLQNSGSWALMKEVHMCPVFQTNRMVKPSWIISPKRNILHIVVF